MIPVLNVTVTRTSDGKGDYIQIMSLDQFSVNVVLIADRIDVQDHRMPPKIVEPRPRTTGRAGNRRS
jgi:hypothetical protein